MSITTRDPGKGGRPFAPTPVLPSEELCDVRVVRTRPRMYLHNLARYLDASPTRRRQLIATEKYPSPYRVSYWPAKRLFREALRLGWDEESLYRVATRRWFEGPAPDDLADFRRKQSMDAVTEFCSLVEPLNDVLDGVGATVRLSGKLWSPLTLGGVLVADSPGIVLNRFRRGDEESGVVSFHVSKTKSHDDESAKLAAALLVALAGENKTSSPSISPQLCFVIDVFSGLIVDGDRGNERRLRRAEMACQEIAAMWDFV